MLKIAKSEIGSNRANRANRFFTVIQYCLDMALVLREMHRVCKPKSRLIFVVGYESSVLGVPFYNSEIISDISRISGAFELAMTQKRTFKNKFGKNIREDILHLVIKNVEILMSDWDEIARSVAHEILSNGLKVVAEDNKHSLVDAIEKVPNLGKSPFLTNQSALDVAIAFPIESEIENTG
ncbi:MAG: hypothetical protein VKL59_16220 [Nostocaceae cyanobacterium]|nr:hypothetical protein [Nostocaceae cyanobacterium]